MSDPRRAKAEDFTTGTSPKGGEVRTLEIWLVMVLEALHLIPLTFAQAIVRGINANPTGAPAGQNLAAGLLAEHWRSLLANDLGEETTEALTLLEQDRAAFEATVEAFFARRLPAPPEPPERPDSPGGNRGAAGAPDPGRTDTFPWEVR